MVTETGLGGFDVEGMYSNKKCVWNFYEEMSWQTAVSVKDNIRDML